MMGETRKRCSQLTLELALASNVLDTEQRSGEDEQL